MFIVNFVDVTGYISVIVKMMRNTSCIILILDDTILGYLGKR